MTDKSQNNSIQRQTKLNMIMSIVYQIISAVCSLILPRFILFSYGSDVNGVLQSINQMLSYTMLMECGIGGLITASFYKPLVSGDTEAVSDIFNNSKHFFDRISIAFAGLVMAIAVFAKAIVKTQFSFWYLCSMAIILGVNYYFNYYFALTHRLLLKADQKLRIIYSAQSVTLVLNTVVCIVAMKLGATIHIVKLVSAVVYLINPAVFRLYVKKHYCISHTVFDKNRKLPKISDGIVHHIAFFIHMNTDIVLISSFLGTKEVSVYSVYNSIICVMENFFSTLSESISSFFGNLIAKEDKDRLGRSFDMYQTVNMSATTFLCIAEAVLIIPFVKIYTGGLSDVNYLRPAFAYTMIVAQWFYCVRMPFYNTINAAGHYKQTKAGAFAEATLNIVISVAMLNKFGLFGVAFGTALAMGARCIYMVFYMSKNIVCRKVFVFFKEMVFNVLLGTATVYFLKKIVRITVITIFDWIFYAIVTCVISLVVIAVFNIVVNQKTAFALLNHLKGNNKKQKQ